MPLTILPLDYAPLVGSFWNLPWLIWCIFLDGLNIPKFRIFYCDFYLGKRKKSHGERSPLAMILEMKW